MVPPVPVRFLELSQPIDGPDGMRALPDGRIVLAENRSGKIDTVRVDGSKAAIETIKDGFKLTPTAVTVIGTTVWVTEAKFAYLNDPKLKDQDPGPFQRGRDCAAATLKGRTACLPHRVTPVRRTRSAGRLTRRR